MKNNKNHTNRNNSNFDNINELLRKEKNLNDSRNSSEIFSDYISNKSETDINEEKSINSTEQKELIYKIFFCKKCKEIPSINFLKDNTLNINCKCKEIMNQKTKDFIEEHLIKKNEKELKKYLYCQIHEKKFIYYCIDCNDNLCEECASLKEHENHKNTFKYLIIDENEIKEILMSIKEIKKELQKGDIENRQNLNIIKAFIKYINDYPCYNQYINFIEFKEYLNSLKSNIPKALKRIKINDVHDFNKELNPLQISSIKIKNSELENFSFLKGLNLKNLEELIWTNGKINSLNDILDINFEKLKVLNLADNNLNIKNLNLNPDNLKQLETLNIFKNKIKSPEVFEYVSKFENLKKLYIGSNHFDEEEIDKFKKMIIHLPKLELLGITTNCFSDSTISFLENLKFESLETLYISRNNLSTLSFMQNIKLEKLKKFWSIQNSLTNIEQLNYLKDIKTLENINLKNNKITDINNLLKIIKNFPNLQELNLQGNNIDINKYKYIIQKAREKIKLLL